MSKEHFLEQHDPERKDFQIDRIILFSDAVFAIAITLLVIEIKAPEILKGFTQDQVIDQLYELLPKFWGFFLSFFVIALNWRSHHRTFGFVNHYTNRLIVLNFYFIFSLVAYAIFRLRIIAKTRIIIFLITSITSTSS